MINLILNDLRLHRGFLTIFGLAYPAYMSYFGSRMNSPRLFLILAAFTFTILPLSIMGREDKFKAAGFRLSLPVTRRDHILSRYLLGWGMMIILFSVTIAIISVLPGAKIAVSTLLTTPTVLLVLAYMTLIFGGLMPLIFRFGMTGLLAFLIGLQLLGVVAMLISRDFVRLIKAAIGAVGNSIVAAESAFGPAGSVLAVLVVLLALNALSFAVSLALFKRKEL